MDDVTDPSDFPATFPTLRALDRTLRCPICKDLYNAPVLVDKCGHSFCSFCIRDALKESEKKECPTCRTAIQESNLRKNIALEESLLAYKEARQSILSSTLSASKPPLLPKRSSTSNKRSRSDSPKAANGAPDGATPRPTQRAKRLKQSSEPTQVEEEEEVEILEEIVEVPNPNRSSDPLKADDPVTCPICQKMVPMHRLNAHIDAGCPIERRDGGKAQWAKLLGQGSTSNTKGKGKEKASSKSDGPDSSPPVRPLAKVSYHTLSAKQIRNLLIEHSLPTEGERTQLVARHAQYITLYNANLDSSKPRSFSQLRKELSSWEKHRAKDEKERVTREQKVEDKGWEESQKSHFAELVAQARASGRANGKSNARVGSEAEEPIVISSDVEMDGDGT